jgi:hypothetical protein
MTMPDIFISYAHVDNEPFGEERARWVTEFAENLGKRLGMVAGDRADVWRDPRLRGNEAIWPTIEEALSGALALVSVISPRYISSDSCQREIALFVQKWQLRGTPPTGHRKPLFKVVKTFVPRDRHPQALREVNGYEFYQEDEATHRYREFGLDPDEKVNRLYWTRLDDLAQDIGALLDEIQPESQPALQPAPAAAGEPVCVYVAQTTRDVREARDAIARELKDRRVEVLPVGDLPPTSDELQAAVRADLARARFSVHIVGKRDGFVPEGDSRSVVEIQYALALEGRTPGLLWSPPGLEPAATAVSTPTTPTATLASRLAPSAIPENRFDFLQGTLDEVKALLLARLAQAPATPPILPAADGLGVYVVHLRSDVVNVQALEAELERRFPAVAANPPGPRSPLRFAVPIGRGTPAQLRMDHEAKLRNSDAVIVVCAHAQRDWVVAKLTELRRAGLASETAARAIFYLPPPDLDLDRFPAARSVDELLTFLGEAARR